MYKPFSYFDPAFVASLTIFAFDFIQATGGTITEYEEGGNFYRSHTFESTGTFEVTGFATDPTFNELEYLIVAGGGGGGSNRGGGGGAGGMLVDSLTATLGTFTMTVGAGGAGGPNAARGNGGKGSDSSAFSQTAEGGGFGAGTSSLPGGDGGSGGGGDHVGSTAGGTGVAGQGFAGGSGFSPNGGGGGGAGEAGFIGNNTNLSAGGDGLANTYKDGVSTFYAGGGGGGRGDGGASVIGEGGLGGGGNGAYNPGTPVAATAGQANTGGGGGGGNANLLAGGAGGSGIIVVRYKIGTVDPDAAAFLTAAGITNQTEKTAINTLVVDLKNAGIWSKMIAIYPYVGGTATTHKWNLKDPRDLDAAYRMTFAGGVTHSLNGIQGNGTTGVGYTHINIGTDITQNDAYTSDYIKTNSQDQTDLGGIGSGNGIQLAARFTDDLSYHKLMHGTPHYLLASTDSSGFWQQSRTLSTEYYVQQNTTRNTASVASQVQTSEEFIAVMAFGLTETTALDFSSRQHAYHAFGQGLTTTEMDDHYTAVQAFQTTLGRNV